MAPATIDSVLLVAFGGPTAPEEIGPFLENVTRGRRIPRARLDEVARHYERMPGGRSPLRDLTVAQARALERRLAETGEALPVFVGMRNWHPYLAETLGEMTARGWKRALAIILSPLRTEASWDRYQRDVAEARAVTPGAPEIVWAPAWFDHPRFIDAVADRARRALDEVPVVERDQAPVVFTAHSVPVAMAERSPYVSDLTTTVRAVGERLGRRGWSLAYQSRSGDPREPWLEPDIATVVRSLASGGACHVVIVPIGFVVDHVEVLYDLDVETRALAHGLGVGFHRAAAVNDHPDFIAMLADLVRRSAAEDVRSQAGRGRAAPTAGHPRSKPASRPPLQ